MRKKFIAWLVAAVAVIGVIAWGPFVSNVEQAKYTVVAKQGSIEIRDYAPMIVAETEVKGPRQEAISEGFRTIADYIFGNNVPHQNVAMTAPVTQQSHGNSWKIRFVMPASFTMESLPKPNNNSVKLEPVEAKRFAVIRFSGTPKEDSIIKHQTELEAFIRKNNLEAASEPIYAFFNPPWTLPFLRRNEVMIEITAKAI